MIAREVRFVILAACVVLAASTAALAQNPPTGAALDAEITNWEGNAAYAAREANPRNEFTARATLGHFYWVRAQANNTARGAYGDDLDRAIENVSRSIDIAERNDVGDTGHMQRTSLTEMLLARAAGRSGADTERALSLARHVFENVTYESSFFDWNKALVLLQRGYSESRSEETIEAGIEYFENAAADARARQQVNAGADLYTTLSILYSSRIRGSPVENQDRASRYATMSSSLRITGSFDQADTDSQHQPFIPSVGAVTSCDSAFGRLDVTLPPSPERLALAQQIVELCEAQLTQSPSQFSDSMRRQSAMFGRYYLGLHTPNGQPHIEAALRHVDAALSTYPANSTEVMPTQLRLVRASLSQMIGTTDVAQAEAAMHTGALRERMMAAMVVGSIRLERSEYQQAHDAFSFASARVDEIIGSGLNERDTRTVMGQAADVYRQGAIATYRANGATAALDFYDRGRSQALRASLDLDAYDLAATERARLNELRTDISLLTLQIEDSGASPTLQQISRLEQLRREADQIIARAGPPTVPRAHDIAFVAPIMAQDETYIFVRNVRGQDSVRVVQGLGGVQLQQAANAWTGAQGVSTPAAIDSRLASTRDAIGALAAEIALALQGAGVVPGDRVALLPDGAMGLLPLTALDAGNGQALGERYEVVLTPSMTAFAHAQRRADAQRARTLIAFANPSGDAALGFSSAETALVASHFAEDARRVIGARSPEAASPAPALAALRGASYWIFSTHGRFDWETPRNSSLLLANGQVLRLGEIRAVAGRLGTPRLVVLSACESGLADPRRAPNEFEGLPGAFMQAGASGVVASLWQVSDASATLLLAKMYDLHLREGQSPSAALRAAQLWLRDATQDDLAEFVDAQEGRITVEDAEELHGLIRGGAERPFASPYHWAAWVFYGT